jgi:tRNA nucleotidyltransferase/poly(A) polymerase
MAAIKEKCLFYDCDISIITNHEKALFKFMDEFCRSDFIKQKLIEAKGNPESTEFNHDILDTAIESPLHMTLRVAGGWVRDLLLGKQSDDVDFCVDVMKGLTIANYLDEYVNKQYFDLGITQYADTKLTKFKIVKMEENADAGKNIAPANIILFFGLDIDFVNLRTEEYDGATRRPVIKFGTFYEDSFRRDLTLNALFYNIHTGKIEDCTGRGYSDLLKDKIIKTPLEPLQTFTDDPLRLLRTLRFISKLGPDYSLDPKLNQFVKDLHTYKEVIEALAIKVPRSRFTKEITKLFQGVGVTKALTVISESPGMINILLSVPETVVVKGIFGKKTKDNAQKILKNLRDQSTKVTTELNKNIVSKIEPLYNDYLIAVKALPETEQLLGKDAHFVLFYSLLAIQVVQGTGADPNQINMYMNYIINDNIGISKDYADHINLICNMVMLLQSINGIPETEENKIIVESHLFSILTQFKGKYMIGKVFMSYHLAVFIYTQYLKQIPHPYFSAININRLCEAYHFVTDEANPIKDQGYRQAAEVVIQNKKQLSTIKSYLSYQYHNGRIPKDVSAVKDHSHITAFNDDPNKALYGVSFYPGKK